MVLSVVVTLVQKVVSLSVSLCSTINRGFLGQLVCIGTTGANWDILSTGVYRDILSTGVDRDTWGE